MNRCIGEHCEVLAQQLRQCMTVLSGRSGDNREPVVVRVCRRRLRGRASLASFARHTSPLNSVLRCPAEEISTANLPTFGKKVEWWITGARTDERRRQRASLSSRNTTDCRRVAQADRRRDG